MIRPLDVMRAIRDARLNAMEKAILYGLVLRADNATGESWPSYHTIAADAGVSVSAAKRCIKELEKADPGGLRLEVRRQKVEGTGWAAVNRYVVRLGHHVVSDGDHVVADRHHVVAERDGGGVPETPGWCPTDTTGGVTQLPDLPILTAQGTANGTAQGTGVAPAALPAVKLEVQEEASKGKKGSKKHQVKIADPRVQRVFEAWKTAKLRHNPRAKPVLTEQRRKIIQARLDDGYDVETLEAACAGIFMSPHHLGENDRQTEYTDLELALRDAKHIETFAELAAEAAPVVRAAPPASVGDPEQARTITGILNGMCKPVGLEHGFSLPPVPAEERPATKEEKRKAMEEFVRGQMQPPLPAAPKAGSNGL